ncbi:MAG: c-type cytochrome biogenesis protein CcmI [Casimicrobiaceae bacterium]|nr:c-type cytochrome biogenesis protein CcmI [Casimicrobiaceae bacterium]MDW8312940.1 c-type cytochrome biogenesis protein CcmI [Burkholderiales bacterium]
MNPALGFVLAASALAILVGVLVARPLWRGDRAPRRLAGERANLEAARIEWQELKRDRALGLIAEEAAREAEQELEARVLAEAQAGAAAGAEPAPTRYRKSAVAVAVSLPVLAVLAYLLIGHPLAVIPEIREPDEAAAKEQLEALFRDAEARLAREPNDLKGWILLGRAKSSVGQFEGAMAAFARAVELDPNDADLWADYADAAAGAAQGRLEGQALELVRKALALNPQHPKALLLLGTWQIQSNRLAEAEQSFRLARQQVDAQSPFAAIAENALSDIAKRQAETGAASAADARAPGADKPRASAAPLMRIDVRLSAEAQAALSNQPEAALFVIVRPAGEDRGPPLAVKRVRPAELAQAVELSAADAMLGGDGLRSGQRVTVLARLALSGRPQAMSGDFESAPVETTLPAREPLAVSVSKRRS